MTPEAFVEASNQLYKELSLLHPECVRMIDSLLALVEEQERVIDTLLATNQKLISK